MKGERLNETENIKKTIDGKETACIDTRKSNTVIRLQNDKREDRHE
jgi:hypothetical protein